MACSLYSGAPGGILWTLGIAEDQIDGRVRRALQHATGVLVPQAHELSA